MRKTAFVCLQNILPYETDRRRHDRGWCECKMTTYTYTPIGVPLPNFIRFHFSSKNFVYFEYRSVHASSERYSKAMRVRKKEAILRHDADL